MENLRVQELRIGNYITFDTVDKPSYFEINLFNYLDRLKPIPLTEKWLLKAGFEKHNLLFFISDYRQIQIVNREIGEFDLIIGNFFFRKIYFLHELQNLYFAITGSELIFSTEP